MVHKLITAHTRVCGFVGDPISHSIGPDILNTAFKELGLDFVYIAFRVSRERLAEAIAGIRALNIKGLNVTKPHKVAVLPLLDDIDELALKIGAVNAITNNDGVLKGYNTDGTGFLQALREGGVEPRGKHVVVLGAGGVSRAICYFLASQGASICILNRHVDRAHELSTGISRHFEVEIKARELNEDNLSGALKEAELLINATSIGTSPALDATLVPAGLLRGNLPVFDVIYNPVKTRLMREAQEKGARVISGLDMLVWQAVPTFEMWTGCKAPIDVMKSAAFGALGYKD